MRVLAGALLLVAASFAANASAPADVRACTGPSIEFAEAVRLSQGSIYAGRIIHVARAPTGSAEITMAVDIVVRGPAHRTLGNVIPPFVCDPIAEGRWGYVVRDVRHPDSLDGSADIFFPIGTSVARAVLRDAGLPDTATSMKEPVPRAPNDPRVLLIVAATATAYLAASGRVRSRPTPARPDGDMAPSTGPRPPSRS